MRFANVETPWTKFGKALDFAFVGRDAVVTVSGVYARFYDWNNGETRIERFEGRERGDGASCVAGLSVAPIFSLVERKSNPRITVFAYPSMRKIARCADSQEANGYACCAFAGTEYLLGQTIFPDFRTIIWQWRTGERLAITDPATIDPAGDLRATFSCSPESPLLVARRLASRTATLTVYRVLSCSKIVRLFPIETSCISDREPPVSFSWTSEGTLLLCDRLGNVEAIEIDDDEACRVGTVVLSSGQPSRNPVLVAHRDGAMLVVATPASGGESNRPDVHATFFRRRASATDRNEHWQPIWTIELPSFPNRAKSHPSDDRIVLLGEGGETMAIIGGSRDRAPRLETLVRDDGVVDQAIIAIAPLRGLSQYFAALSSRPECRLFVLDATTGMVISSRNRRPSLSHHGEVTRLVSHSSLPVLATCSVAGNCLVLDVSTPSATKIARCAHLQKEPLDRLKFSEEGNLLGVGSSRLGRVFLLKATTAAGKVVAAVNVGRQLVDFLIYGTDSRAEATLLVLVVANETRPVAGNAIAVFSCQLNGHYHQTPTADRVIMLTTFLYESLHGAGKSGANTAAEAVLAIPYLSNQLHRIEFETDFREATLTKVVPSLHRTRNLGIGLHRGRTRDRALLIACAYDGSIVAREDANTNTNTNTLQAIAIFVAHHRSEGGTRSAVLVADLIVSLGRNGDLAANRIVDANGKRVRDVADRPDSPRSNLKEFAGSEHESKPGPESESEDEGESEPTAREEELSNETWMERSLRKRIAAEERRTRAARLSILEDFHGLRLRIKALLDSNETEAPAARVPIRAFDLDSEARERKLAAAKSTEKRLSESVELEIDRYDRASRYLRERFLEPMRVRPSCVSSVLAESKVTNYPLTEINSEDADLLSWCRFSETTRRAVSRLEAEYESEPLNEENSPNLFDSRHGYLQVREASILANDNERAVKIRFNQLYEETRSIKRRETNAAIELAEDTRRCVTELLRTFGVDASDRLLNASLWHGDAEAFSLDGDRVESRLEPENTGTEEEKRGTNDPDSNDHAFRRSAIERMMDGVLEVGLEENAKRIVPMPSCLINEIDPASYTREDVEEMKAYENKLSALRADRLAYRSTLEENVDRANGEFYSRARAFDDRLSELAAEKIRVERSVLSERLTASWRILWHRRIGQRRREIRRAIERELTPAVKRMRALAAESELFEAGLIELRTRYEASRRRDKLLEEKYRADFLDSKQPMAAEQLFRHYRKRPRTALTAACGTSLVFLRELAERVLEPTTIESELLPREWLAYPRGLHDLDATPDGGLPSRVEADQWREACALRRLKIEAEIKVKSCAIELAEAEQSLAFHRRACSSARAAVARRKENVGRLEKAMLELFEDQEVRSVLKTGQLRDQPCGSSASEWSEAVLIPRRELVDVAEAVAAAGQRKLTELRRLVNLRRALSQEEWRRERLRCTMEDLRASLLDLTNVKARKLDGRRFAETSLVPRAQGSKDLRELAAESVDPRNLTSTKLSFRQLEETVREERRRSRRISVEARSWRRRNSELKRRIQETEVEMDRMAAGAASASAATTMKTTRNPLRVRTFGFRERKMRAIARKANLARAVRSNFEELTALESRLEISKLRTYPTLRLKI